MDAHRDRGWLLNYLDAMVEECSRCPGVDGWMELYNDKSMLRATLDDLYKQNTALKAERDAAKCTCPDPEYAKQDHEASCPLAASRPGEPGPKYPCGCEIEYRNQTCAVCCPVHGVSMFQPLPDPPKDADQ